MYPGHWANVKPETPAVIDAASGEQLTWRELNERSNQVAQLLSQLGLGVGDHVSDFHGEYARFLPHRLGRDALRHVPDLHQSIPHAGRNSLYCRRLHESRHFCVRGVVPNRNPDSVDPGVAPIDSSSAATSLALTITPPR